MIHMYVDKIYSRYAARVEVACEKANALLKDGAFLAFLHDSKPEGFEFTGTELITGRDVAEKIVRSEIESAICSYTPRWYQFVQRNVLAYVSHGDTVIYINTWNLARSVESIAGTLVHEYTHVIGYEHGNNSSKGKQDSIPYWMGSAAKNWLESHR